MPGVFICGEHVADLKTVKCPRCRKDAVWEGNPDRPFCSERCRLIDLAAWAEEAYRVPAEKLPGDENENE